MMHGLRTVVNGVPLLAAGGFRLVSLCHDAAGRAGAMTYPAAFPALDVEPSHGPEGWRPIAAVRVTAQRVGPALRASAAAEPW